MKISQTGIELLKKFEGLRLKAYPDPATGGKPWTIGYGCTTDVYEGLVITEQEAEGRLRLDLYLFERCVEQAIDVEMTQNQFDACVVLAFNIGCKNFSNSTLVKLMNAGKADEAKEQFSRWNRANGSVMAGLTRRREAEAELFAART